MDLVLGRVFHVNTTQLNEGRAFANRWAGPYKVIDRVVHESYRLELPVRAASRMGRVLNAVELKPYQLRRAEDSERVLRPEMRDRTNPNDFPDPNAPDIIDLDPAVSSPNPALPRWQQQMDATDGAPQEPGLDDIRHAVAGAPPRSPRAPARIAEQTSSSSRSPPSEPGDEEIDRRVRAAFEELDARDNPVHRHR